MRHKFDALVLGSGAAGLTLGLNLAKTMKIAVLSKNSLEEGSTYYAQGGISAVLSTSDSNESHVNDTLIAGADLCDKDAVEFTVKNGASAIEWLQQINVPFTKSKDTESGLHLTREGGHSHRRIVHADDATGSAVEKSLLEQTLEHPNIEMFAEHVAINLITTSHHGQSTCIGAYVYNKKESRVDVFQAKFVILATGGASKTYLYTSNPDGATGDGIAMAWRAGCRIANMEFMQFHPTCLYHPQAKNFLISEAVRGEGGHLILSNGERFMSRFDERMELAPRDIVARAIDHEIKRLGCDSVYLDISHKSADSIKKHFPTIYEKCLTYGYDMTKDPLPVVPAAHYTCGGVITDLKARTDIVNLYAVGEVSCTGLHGANRLASNSILECLVFGKAAADDIMSKHSMPMIEATIDAWDESRVTNSDEQVVVTHNWNELRRFMWDYVGIVRSTKRLQRAKHRIDLLNKEIDEYYSNFKVNADLIELRNLAQVADLIIRSAMSRKESRGLHYTLDYPEKNATLDETPSILKPGTDKSVTPLHIGTSG